MERAKITNKDGYRCYIMGQLVTANFNDEVEGQVAKFALADGAAKAVFPKKAPAKRKTKNAGAAPENKAKK